MSDFNLLIAVTGSVATIKLPELILQLKESFKRIEKIQLHIKVIVTSNSLHFFDRNAITETVHTDDQEWSSWSKIGDPVLHIELRKWASLMLIAPLDANTMAKIANGICDNLLTCVVRAWDMKKPLLFAPAMNTHMYEHVITSQHLIRLEELGYLQIPAICKRLACGDYGQGAMAQVSSLVEKVLEQALCLYSV